MTPSNRPTTEEIATLLFIRSQDALERGEDFSYIQATKEALDNLAAEKDVEIAAKQDLLERMAADQADTDTKARGYAKKVLTEFQVDGDSYAVPTLFCIVKDLTDKIQELQASLSLAVGALKEISEGGLFNPAKYESIARQALSSPAIQKEVQRIEAMERVISEAHIHSESCENAEDLREAIKAYEESSK